MFLKHRPERNILEMLTLSMTDSYLYQTSAFRSLFMATDTSDVFSFDEDGSHSSQLSAS